MHALTRLWCFARLRKLAADIISARGEANACSITTIAVPGPMTLHAGCRPTQLNCDSHNVELIALSDQFIYAVSLRTVPEFVCSVKVDIRSEPQPSNEGWVGPCKVSSTDDEQQQAHALRQLYWRKLSHCKPCWLHGGSVELKNDQELLEALQMFNSIDGQLSCQVPADRVRALYPVLFNVPVQDHDELMSLAVAVTRRMEELMPGANLCQKAQEYLETVAEVERGGATQVLPNLSIRGRSRLTNLTSAVSRKASSLLQSASIGGWRPTNSIAPLEASESIKSDQAPTPSDGLYALCCIGVQAGSLTELGFCNCRVLRIWE